MPTNHLLIKGLVQGVYYRAAAREMAKSLHLTGRVKNTPEGYVEVMVSGDKETLHRFIDWCRQGPPAAKVSSLEVTELTDQYFAEFIILR